MASEQYKFLNSETSFCFSKLEKPRVTIRSLSLSLSLCTSYLFFLYIIHSKQICKYARLRFAASRRFAGYRGGGGGERRGDRRWGISETAGGGGDEFDRAPSIMRYSECCPSARIVRERNAITNRRMGRMGRAVLYIIRRRRRRRRRFPEAAHRFSRIIGHIRSRARAG